MGNLAAAGREVEVALAMAMALEHPGVLATLAGLRLARAAPRRRSPRREGMARRPGACPPGRGVTRSARATWMAPAAATQGGAPTGTR